MNEYIVPGLLQLLGIIVIIAEVFIPSAGLLAVMAIGIFGYSLYHVFTQISVNAGLTLLIGDLILIPTLVIMGLKLLANSPLALRKTLSQKDGITSRLPEFETYIGSDGVSLTVLRPAGIVELQGKRVDAISRGEYIEKNTPVVVIDVSANQVIVRKKTDT